MANQQHLELLQQGSNMWNTWRKQHPEVKSDFRGADLNGADLNGADLNGADLNGADLSGVNLWGANLSRTDLIGADLSGADLSSAHLVDTDLSGANLSGANLSRTHLRGATLIDATLSRVTLIDATLSDAILSDATLSRATLIDAILSRADLSRADLSGAHLSKATINAADLSGANLSRATLIDADLSGATLSRANLSEAILSRANLNGAMLIGTILIRATLTSCSIHGISVWNIQLDEAKQENLVITEKDESTITVDNLEVAQFIYLLLNNSKIRDVIDTIAKKAVLILGRFTPERKAVLDALREALRTNGYLPILFDFEKPSSRNFTETVKTLAHLSRFIIADLTDPASIPQELYAIVPTLAVPIQPLVEVSQKEYSMFDDLKRTYHWILPTYRYTDLSTLLTSLPTHLIAPAEQKADELSKR